MAYENPQEVFDIIRRRVREQQSAVQELQELLPVATLLEDARTGLRDQQAALERIDPAAVHARVNEIENGMQRAQSAIEALRSYFQTSSLSTNAGAADVVGRLHQIVRVKSLASRLERSLAGEQLAVEALRGWLKGKPLKTSGTLSSDPGVKESSYFVPSAEGDQLEPSSGDEVLVLWGLEERPAQVLRVWGPPLRRSVRVRLEDGAEVDVPLDAVRHA